MCVYTTQNAELTTNYPMWKDYTIRNPLPPALWLEDPNMMDDSYRPQLHDRKPVIGIGDWATIMYRKGGQTWWDWAQFAPAVKMWPTAKPSPYFNAKVETLEDYLDGKKESDFSNTVIDKLENNMCVFWVDSFFESNGNKAQPRWYHIKRTDGKMIPLAGFYQIMDNPKQGTAWPAFTIITRDPYDLVAQTGHERSPGILPYDHIDNWLCETNSVRAKLSMLADAPAGEFVIDEVERSSVTKKTDHATEPIEGGRNFVVGSLS